MKKTVYIEGMSCMHCKMRVENALKTVPGVTGAAVDLKKGIAAIEGQNIADESIFAAVRKAGYDPKKIEG
ncbi:MAG: heavy-metal-associated domain-containing protein [Bacillota bacterium]|nr:heavy-metal-associated domain-containing protein [Bacillota bacterium]